MRSKIIAPLLLVLGLLSNTGLSQVTVSISPTATTICAGGSVTFTGSATGGVSPYTYSWTPGTGLSSTTTSVTVASPTVTTVYTLSVTDNMVITGTATVQVTVNPTPTISLSSNSPVCDGQTINLTSSTGASSPSYTWTGPSSFIGYSSTANIASSPSSAGTYTLDVLDIPTGCSNTATINVVDNPLPTVSVNNLSLCPAGSGTLTASGANTYNWSPSIGLSSTFGTAVTANPTVTTVYTVTGTSAAGCIGSASSTVTVNASPTITVSGTNSICTGGSTTLTGSGASTYTWSANAGGATTSTVVVSPSVTTTYTLSGTSAAGCTGMTATTVSVNVTPTVSATGGSICAGGSTPLNASGATTYSWSPSGSLSASTGSSVTASPTISTVYTVTGTTASGCTGNATCTVTVNASPTVNISGTTAICNGGSTTLTGSGATTYSWSTGATTASTLVSPTVTTSYTLTGTNAVGCTGTSTIAVSVNANPTVTVNSATICAVQQTATLTATGATSYTWNPVSSLSSSTGSTVTATPTVSTIYTVTGTSAAGCLGSASTTVIVNATPAVLVNSPTICSGSSGTLTASGATTYSWNPSGDLSASSGSTVLATPTVSTIYTITGTDANGCVGTGTSTVTVNPSPNISIGGSTAVCSGLSTTLTATGATSYTWSTGATSSSIVVTPTASTTYTVDGDAGGCTGSQTVTVTVYALPSVNLYGTNITCNGTCNGSDSAYSLGAVTYAWSPGGSSSPAIHALCSGTYSVTVTDANGCTNTAQNLLADPTAISVSFNNIVNASCPGVTNGSVDGVASGGTPAYTYAWSDGSTSPTISGLASGAYTLVVTDASGCKDSSSVNILNAGSGPSVTLSYPSALCQGQQGQLTYTASGGIAPYTVLWKDVVTATTLSNTDTALVTPLVSGSYTVALSLVDQGGCASHDSAFINVGAADSLSGTIVEPNSNPVTAGEVYLFQQKSSNVGLLDTAGYTNIMNGTYSFPNAFYGDYYVKVIADTNVYPTSIATYYSNRAYPFQWDSALVINHHTCTGVNAGGYNISILEITPLTGSGIISGVVTEGPGYGHRWIGGGLAPMGAPLKGIDVKLGRNPGGSPAARTMTDTSGKYTFTNVPLNLPFTIYVDIPNYGMDSTLTVTLTSADSVSTSNNYYVDSLMVRVNDTTSLSIVEEKGLIKELNVYPNPSQGLVQYELNSQRPGTNFELWITDLSGKEMLRLPVFTNHELKLDLHALPAGVYLMHVKTQQSLLSKKIIIQR